MQAQEHRTTTWRNEAARERYVKSFRELQAGSLLCRKHPALKAFAICSRCGFGTCRDCTVAVGIKRYCKDDAETLLRRTRQSGEAKKRGVAVTAASALAYAEGAVASAVGFLFIVLGLLAPTMQQANSYSIVAPTFAYFGSVFAFPSLAVMGLGAVIFSLGVLDILAGNMLWRSSRAAAIIAIAVAVTAALVGGTYIAVFAVVGAAIYLLIALGVANIGTLVAGWAHLR